MDIQIYRLLEEEYTVDLFRSEISHMRKQYSDKEFVTILLKYDFITHYWEKQWYYQALYILALLDYLSDKHHVSYLQKYEYYRSQKLKYCIYPAGITMWNKLNPQLDLLTKTLEKCKSSFYSQYFLKYNIIEPEEEL